MYTKDNTRRISIRLTETQHGYLERQSKLLGITPSEYLRQVLNYAIGQAIIQERNNPLPSQAKATKPEAENE